MVDGYSITKNPFQVCMSGGWALSRLETQFQALHDGSVPSPVSGRGTGITQCHQPTTPRNTAGGEKFGVVLETVNRIGWNCKCLYFWMSSRFLDTLYQLSLVEATAFSFSGNCITFLHLTSFTVSKQICLENKA